MAALGIAGMDKSGWDAARPAIQTAAGGKLSVAGLNCKQIVQSVTANCGIDNRKGRRTHRLGDLVDQSGWRFATLMVDYTYAVCTTDRGRGQSLRWRAGRELMFDRQHRKLPVYLDCAAYRIWTGKAPKWAGFDTYLKAINLVDPDGFAAFDVRGDQAQSLYNFQTMGAMGYGPERGCFPVYHVGPQWRKDATMTGLRGHNSLSAAARCAIANARIAAQDPVLRFYVSQSRLVGLGGMVRGPVPRDVRHLYLIELCRQFPDHDFWALGQANYKVVNGLIEYGYLDRIWLDGTWYLLDGASGRFAVLEDGRLKLFSLRNKNAATFFTYAQLIGANLRALLGAYAGIGDWPRPKPLPVGLDDPAQAQEMSKRLEINRRELDDLYGNVAVVKEQL